MKKYFIYSSIVVTIFLLIFSVNGCGSVATSGGSSSGISNPWPDGNITLNFVNSSGIAANRIHIVIRGYYNDGATIFGYYDLSKEPAKFVVTNDINDIPDTTLDTLISRGASTIGYLNAGRVYIGIDRRVATEPPGWTTPDTSTGPIFDKFELTIKESGPNINLTQVDFFGMPLKITCSGEVRGFNDGMSRAQIFDDYIAAVDATWETLVICSSDATTRLLILNPGKIAAVDSASFGNLTNYWYGITTEYWANGHTVTILTDDDPRRQLNGTADGSKIDFGADGAFIMPNSTQMFGQDVVSGSNANIVKWMSGTINRGVIKNPNVNDQGDSTKFYTGSVASNEGLYNYYAEFLHRPAYSISGRAYAIAFDDVFGYSSDLGVSNHGVVTIEVQPME